METQESQVQNPKTEKTAEQVAQENQLGVVMVIERLFRAVDAGTYPLRVHEDVMAGMNFLAQFHKQLVSQLPPALLEEVKRRNSPPVAVANAPEVSNEPAKA